MAPAMLLAVLFGLLLGGCGGATPVHAPSPTEKRASPDQAACARAIPDSVMAAFGWTPGPAVTLSGGGCQRDAADTAGTILVTAPVLADPSESGAHATLKSDCDSISGQSAGEVVEPSVTWLGSAQGCARSRLTPTGLGLLEIYAVRGTTLLDVTVSITSPSTVATREAGAKALVEAAAAAL